MAKKRSKKIQGKRVMSEVERQVIRARNAIRNLKHRRFAEYYVKDPDCFGNGTTAYAKAYNINLLDEGAYNNCSARASELVRNSKICDYIRSMLDASSLNDLNADRQLAFVMNQFENLPAKISALREFNKLRGRITDKHKLTGKIEVAPVMFGAPNISGEWSGKPQSDK